MSKFLFFKGKVIGDKPPFLHWAHMSLWSILADNPTWDKAAALSLLRKNYPNKIPLTVAHGCFACDSRENYKRITGINWRKCPTYCPIRWEGTKNLANSISCTNCISPYSKWIDAWSTRDFDLASRYALEIKNLPLSRKAHEIFLIKTSPRD